MRQADIAKSAKGVAQRAARDAKYQAKVATANAAKAKHATDRATLARRKAQLAAVHAHAQELAFRALANVNDEPEESLRYVLAAVKLERTPFLARVLRDALVATHGRFVLPGSRGAMHEAVFSPDGSLAATADDAALRFFRTANGKLVRSLRTGSPVLALEFAPDGTEVAAGTRDGRTIVVDVASGAVVRTLPGTGAASTVAYSPDGRLLARASAGRTVTTWDAASGLRLWQATLARSVRSA